MYYVQNFGFICCILKKFHRIAAKNTFEIFCLGEAAMAQ